MTPLYTTTGSDVLSPVLFVDGDAAASIYGVSRYEGGPCPVCKFPAGGTCFFNPRNSYFYWHCPSCLRWFRWINSEGKLDDLKQISSAKVTPVDENIDFENSKGWFS